MYRSGSRSSSASWCSTVCTTKHPSTSSTSASLSSVSPPDNIFALPAEVFSSCLAIVSAVMVSGFCGRPWDMELVIRQSERSGHQQAFTEDVFTFSLLVRVHSALDVFGWCALQIYLLTYFLPSLAGGGGGKMAIRNPLINRHWTVGEQSWYATLTTQHCAAAVTVSSPAVHCALVSVTVGPLSPGNCLPPDSPVPAADYSIIHTCVSSVACNSLTKWMDIVSVWNNATIHSLQNNTAAILLCLASIFTHKSTAVSKKWSTLQSLIASTDLHFHSP